MNNNFLVNEYHDDHNAEKRDAIQTLNLSPMDVARLHQERRVHFEQKGFSIQLRGDGFTALHRGLDNQTDYYVTFKMQQIKTPVEAPILTLVDVTARIPATLPTPRVMAMAAHHDTPAPSALDDDAVRVPIRRARR